MSKPTDAELLALLGVTIEAPVAVGYTAEQERILAGFEDIVGFVEEHGHPPRHGEDLDIFERLYAVRLEQIRKLPEAHVLLGPLDMFGLLAEPAAGDDAVAEIPDDELLSALGVSLADEANVTVLRNVLSREEKRAAEEIANRTPCEDFEEFRGLFDSVEADLASGRRKTSRFGGDIDIQAGDFFVLYGQIAYVAKRGATFKSPSGSPDARLRLIYSNATESNLLMRSLQKALHKDEAGRRVSNPDKPSLFSEDWSEDDVSSGTIYVLRSNSNVNFIAENRSVVHKIGVTGGDLAARLSHATQDATFLFATVEVVASYKMAGINRAKLEQMLHRVFAPALLDLTIEDRFGKPVHPKEWFLVPLEAIDDAIGRIRDGSITEYVYDPQEAKLVRVQGEGK